MGRKESKRLARLSLRVEAVLTYLPLFSAHTRVLVSSEKENCGKINHSAL